MLAMATAEYGITDGERKDDKEFKYYVYTFWRQIKLQGLILVLFTSSWSAHGRKIKAFP